MIMLPKKIYLREKDLHEYYGSERMMAINEPYEELNVEYINLNNTWHDASEEPEESVDILCDDLDGGFRLINWVAYTSWADYCFINGITKWAYVRDLLPEGGDR